MKDFIVDDDDVTSESSEDEAFYLRENLSPDIRCVGVEVFILMFVFHR